MYREKVEFYDPEVLSEITQKIIAKLNQDQIDEYLEIVSINLSSEPYDEEITRAFEMLLPKHWPRLSEVTKIRVEEMIISDILKGVCFESEHGNLVNHWGNLGVSARNFLEYFDFKYLVLRAFSVKLERAEEEVIYILKNFSEVTKEIVSHEEKEDFLKLIKDLQDKSENKWIVSKCQNLHSILEV
ncbi:MAG: hypothetical protein AAF708_17805 [Deinococcota bacterium]